ncbi:DUF4347 domain-containing protein [Caulobacter segnis]
MPNMAAPLLPCVTIDATQNDGYLDNARAGTPLADANAGTAAVAANLDFCGGPAGSIVGHGAEGDIDTYKATGECITVNNQNDWGPDLAQLHGKLTSLTLYSCCVGGGVDGALLLQNMANVVGAPVSAPTGLIYCDNLGNFSLEVGAVWNTVAPAAAANAAPPPPPAPPPSPPSSPMPTDILSAVYLPKDGAQVTGAKAMAIVKQVVWKPYTPPMSTGASSTAPGAKQTGKLQVSRKSPAGSGPGVVTETYLVLAHRLLQDSEDPTLLYQTTGNFQALVTAK